MDRQPIDAFICVHKRDVGYLFELALRSYMVNFEPKGRLTLITNDRGYLTDYVARMGLEGEVSVSGDEEWLSRQELGLPGWYRQQIIKLRSHQLCATEHLCSLGADTVLLQPITYDDLVAGELPILYYRSHMPPDIHWWYECRRVASVARILGVWPGRALRYIDFISDLFCFNREVLASLNRELERRYGEQPYASLLGGLSTTPGDQRRFGEWTLYSTYLLDGLRRPVTLRDSARGFLHQVHSGRTLGRYRFDTKVVHFVSKELDRERIRGAIVSHGLALGKHLGAAAGEG